MYNIHFYYSGNTIYCLMYSRNAKHDHFRRRPNAPMRFTCHPRHEKRSCDHCDALSLCIDDIINEREVGTMYSWMEIIASDFFVGLYINA